MNNFAKSFFDRLTPRTQSALESLMSSDLVQGQLERQEAMKLEKMAALNPQASAVEAAYRKEAESLEIAGNDAAKRLRAAEAELAAAKQAYAILQMQAHACEVKYLVQMREISDLIQQECDPRIERFAFHLEQLLQNDVRLSLHYWTKLSRRTSALSGEFPLASNLAEVSHATEALRLTIAKVRAWKNEALTYVELSQRLMDTCSELAPVLAALEINPPSLTAEDVEPGWPITWGGESAWITGTPIERESQPIKRTTRAGQARAAA